MTTWTTIIDGVSVETSADPQTSITWETISGESSEAVQTNLDSHINDSLDSHAASAITNTPAGNVTATNVQTAINELDERFSKPFVILALGQSNMSGFSDCVGGDYSENQSVYLWNGYGTGTTTYTSGTEFVIGEYGVAPLHQGTAPNYVKKLSFETAKSLQKLINRPVYVIEFSVGGHSIESFISAASRTTYNLTLPVGELDLYEDYITTDLPLALSIIPGAPTTIDAIIVHQGEANSTDSEAEYALKLQIALNGFASYSPGTGINAIPKVVGEVAASLGNVHYTRHKTALIRYANVHRNVGVVTSTRETLTAVNGVHFDHYGISSLGLKYAGNIVNIKTPELPIEPTFNPEEGLIGYTASTQFDNYARIPYPVDDLTFVDDATMGFAIQNTVSGNAISPYTRKVYQVGSSYEINVEYIIRADTASDTLDHRIVIYQWENDGTAIGAYIVTPAESPLAGVSAVTTVTETITSGLDAAAAYIAVGINIGVGADDGAYTFRIVKIQVS